MFGDVWQKILFDLSELRDLFNMRLETRQEAKGNRIEQSDGSHVWRDATPRWFDEDLERSVRPWLLLPYVDAVDHGEISERLEAGKRLLDSVGQRVAARHMTPELLHDWGLLNRWAGAIQLVYQMKPDARQLRAGNNNLDAHKRWFAHYYLKIQPPQRRDEGNEIMEAFINSIAQGLPEGPEKMWFAKFLGSKKSDSLEGCRKISKPFREQLTIRQMKELDKTSLEGLPAFSLEYPTPRASLD